MEKGEKIETLLRKGEILLDSGTQKLLRSLAYVRYVRRLVKDDLGSWQFTLTHAPQSKSMRKTDGFKKKWNLRLKEKGVKPFEYGLFAECWFCNRIFQKTVYCKKCGFFQCPHCNKCACSLPKCCFKVAKKFLRAIKGEVPPFTKLGKGK